MELHKKDAESRIRSKEFAKLYEVVKNERNSYVNAIQASSQALAEMKERIKILNNEVDILKVCWCGGGGGGVGVWVGCGGSTVWGTPCWCCCSAPPICATAPQLHQGPDIPAWLLLLRRTRVVRRVWPWKRKVSRIRRRVCSGTPPEWS